MSAEVSEPRLPRLLYIGDVPVESSYHGSALLYRLLQNYPRETLCIVEAGLSVSQHQRRIEGVEYRSSLIKIRRITQTRFRRVAESMILASSKLRNRFIRDAAKGFKAEAVLTVAHGYSWMNAVAYANAMKLPLHLIVHDDWPSLLNCPRFLQRNLKQYFSKAYRQASSRLCVSPFMAHEYERRYGIGGDVLYPSRAEDGLVFLKPKDSTNSSPFTVGYAGTLATPDYVRQLNLLGTALQRIGGKLFIYGPEDPTKHTHTALGSDAVVFRGMLSSNELIRTVRAEVDLLFLPMSFADNDTVAMSMNFPSKLTDYTACGLPILIWGPPTSSAVRWAQMERDATVVVESPEVTAIEEQLSMLRLDGGRRTQLGLNAIQVGIKYFDFHRNQNLFTDLLRKPAKQSNLTAGKPESD